MYHRVIKSRNFSVSYTDRNNRLFNNVPVLYLSIFQFDATIHPEWAFRAARKVSSFISHIKLTVKSWERQMQLAQLRRSTVCSGVAEEYWHFDDHIVVECEQWHRGAQVHCARCSRILRLEFPQGWRYYPGDVCPHGKYIGGCGADLMCGRCESGQ
jgi:hypothetical protein